MIDAQTENVVCLKLEIIYPSGKKQPNNLVKSSKTFKGFAKSICFAYHTFGFHRNRLKITECHSTEISLRPPA